MNYRNSITFLIIFRKVTGSLLPSHQASSCSFPVTFPSLSERSQETTCMPSHQTLSCSFPITFRKVTRSHPHAFPSSLRLLFPCNFPYHFLKGHRKPLTFPSSLKAVFCSFWSNTTSSSSARSHSSKKLWCFWPCD